MGNRATDSEEALHSNRLAKTVEQTTARETHGSLHSRCQLRPSMPPGASGKPHEDSCGALATRRERQARIVRLVATCHARRKQQSCGARLARARRWPRDWTYSLRKPRGSVCDQDSLQGVAGLLLPERSPQPATLLKSMTSTAERSAEAYPMQDTFRTVLGFAEQGKRRWLKQR